MNEKISDFKLSEGGEKVVLEAVLHSPLNVPVTIKELSVEFPLDGSSAIAILRLPEAVVVPAQGSANLELEGVLPEAETLPTPPSTEELTFGSIKMTLDIGGIELRLEESELGGVIDV
ncbi:MAG: hypothetical protein ACXQTR_01550 [Candidatus Methanospirareceae archaeon]